MGDSSFDIYWYDYLYDISDFRHTLAQAKYPTQFFNSMGNHDNDGATPCDENTDFNASAKYRKAFGPTYYSVNIGKVHYIMLDNIRYRNEKTKKMKKGKYIVGSRNYDHVVVEDQLEWLRKDLAMIEDKNTPIVVGMHAPVFRMASEHNSKELYSYFNDSEGNRTLPPALYFASTFAEFKQVHFLTGHSHKLITTHCKMATDHPEVANIIDHNVGAICGAWWFTAAHGGPHLAPDGAPAGFKVFPVEGKNIEWYYTSTDCGAEKQFRTFDLNSVRDYYKNNGEMRVFLEVNSQRTDFAKVEDNRVAIHIWDWAPDWKISVKENGRELAVKRKKAEHPLMLAALDIPNALWLGKFTEKDIKSVNKRKAHPHMFHVTTSAPDSTIEVTVTDSFGNVYTETMVRPKAFHKFMK